MIEKLKYTEYRSGGEDMTLRIEKIPAQPWEMQEKINELVDAVNELQTKVNKMAQNLNFAQPVVKENFTTDTYAEQRKWIGKLCRFWDYDYDPDYFDTLKGITDEGLFIGHNGSWKHCEPIKPTDSIIYKGGDNE